MHKVSLLAPTVAVVAALLSFAGAVRLRRQQASDEDSPIGNTILSRQKDHSGYYQGLAAEVRPCSDCGPLSMRALRRRGQWTQVTSFQRSRYPGRIRLTTARRTGT